MTKLKLKYWALNSYNVSRHYLTPPWYKEISEFLILCRILVSQKRITGDRDIIIKLFRSFHLVYIIGRCIGYTYFLRLSRGEGSHFTFNKTRHICDREIPREQKHKYFFAIFSPFRKLYLTLAHYYRSTYCQLPRTNCLSSCVFVANYFDLINA